MDTIRMETSDGVTPPMREAWPIDSGFTLLSFSLPSVESALIFV
jgi:hypothetical protein